MSTRGDKSLRVNFSQQSLIVLVSLNRPTTMCFQPSTTCYRKPQHTNNDMFGQTATNLQRNVFATHDHVFADSNQPTNINQSATNELFAHAATNHQRLVFASRIPPTDRGLPSNDNLCPQAANNRPTTTRFRNQPTSEHRHVWANNDQLR